MKMFGKELKFNNNKVYHSGDKPTINEIGAAASNHNHDSNYLGKTATASAATKLATVRSINGTNFDGTANITTANWGTTRTLTIGNTGKSVNGAGNVTWSLSEIGASPSNHNHDSAYLKTSAKAADSDKVDGLHANAFGRAYSGSHNFGGNQNAITTAQFITMLTSLGAFNQAYWVSRGSWSYANNQYINDTNCGDIHLAGCTVEVIGTSNNHTIRVHAPTTSSSGIANADYIYVNNGSGYMPGWRRLINDKGGIFKGAVYFNELMNCYKQAVFEDGFNIPTRSNDRYGFMINTYGNGNTAYTEFAQRNPNNTDWDWGYSMKMYRTYISLHALEINGGGGGALRIKPGANDHCYISFYPRSNNSDYRGAWMGYGSSGSNDFWISAGSGEGRVNVNSLKSFAESIFCRQETYLDPAPGYGCAIKAYGDFGLGGSIILADGSSGEKTIKYNYAQQKKGWGLYFNDSSSGWYDWHNNRGVWNYNPGGGTFEMHRSTTFHSPVRFLSSVDGIYAINSVYSRTGITYSSSEAEKLNIVKINNNTKAVNSNDIKSTILNGIRNADMATYNYKEKSLSHQPCYDKPETAEDTPSILPLSEINNPVIDNARIANSDKTYIGFIAEELERENPEFLKLIGSSYIDSNGVKQYEIREMSVVGALWTALQEAFKEIDVLKAKIK